MGPMPTHIAKSWFGMPGMPVKLPAFMAVRSCMKWLPTWRAGWKAASTSTPTSVCKNLRHAAVSGVVCGSPQAMK